MNDKQEKLEYMGIRIYPSVRKKLKSIAEETDLSISWLIRDAIKKYINDRE